MRGSAEAVAEDTSRLLNMLGKHDPDASNSLASFAFALARVAWADDKVLDAERRAVREVLRDSVGLGPGEIDLVMELSLMKHQSDKRSARPLDSARDASERNRLFIESLYKIAASDDHIVDAEVMEIDAIAEEFGIGAETVEQARARIDEFD